MRIGAAYWALATPWFEFYLPFNVLREPWPLVAFEALLWAATLTTFSLALAWSTSAWATGRHPWKAHVNAPNPAPARLEGDERQERHPLTSASPSGRCSSRRR
ncbi:MAG: hypothetical protein U0Q12_28355 [Vicinamibacterales bacterium]